MRVEYDSETLGTEVPPRLMGVVRIPVKDGVAKKDGAGDSMNVSLICSVCVVWNEDEVSENVLLESTGRGSSGWVGVSATVP